MPPVASSRCSPAVSRPRVRVVGKITAPVSQDLSADGIRVSVLKSEEEASKHATVVFESRKGSTVSKESYKLDWCYGSDEDVEKLFLEEVKPMIQGIFNGADASVIEFGSKDGDTLLSEGCDGKPGLASLAVSEILNICKSIAHFVRISFYEIYQERIFDSLEQKEHEVQVLEDQCGQTQLRGLSQSNIESIADFNRLCLNCKTQSACQNASSDSTIKSHKGLILYVYDGKPQAHVVGRLNFINLAGYEEITPKAQTKPLAMEMRKINKIDKSFYALQNVIFALNSNKKHVPYRGCKLTHILKDFISRKKSQALMVACLKLPSRETIRALAMSSYACTATSLLCDSGKKKSIPRPTTPSSQTFSVPNKKSEPLHLASIDKKPNAANSISRGRKLFNMGGSGSSIPKSMNKVGLEVKSSYAITLDMELIGQDKEEIEKSLEKSKLVEGSSTSSVLSASELIEQVPLHSLQLEEYTGNNKDTNFQKELSSNLEDSVGEEMHGFICTPEKMSPPISEKLRDIANSLRLLGCQQVATYDKDAFATMEPQTPQEIFKTRSSGLKRCLIEELLTYINTATREELMELKGIGEKRANLILELRAQSPQAFKNMKDLKDIGLSSKQVKEMMRVILGDFCT